jgi:VWFA-related protein
MKGSAARAVAVVAAIAAMAGSRTDAQQAQPPSPPGYVETVNVASVLVDARVLDDRGLALRGLRADDFSVHIDGRPARVQSLSWTGTSETAARPGASPGIPEFVPRPPGRLIVMLFQRSLEGTRAWGMMRMLELSRHIIEDLSPDDRVAILTFDTRLRLWSDFTADRARLSLVLERGILFEDASPEGTTDPAGPSIAAELKPSLASRTRSVEKALTAIADALRPLPGAKSLLFYCHSLGRLSVQSNAVSMEKSYEGAKRALLAARTSVFSLDVVKADGHSLDIGLQTIAEDTGGYFLRTFQNPEGAIRSVSESMSGYYSLFVERPNTSGQAHRITVELVSRKGLVFARSSYVDPPASDRKQ